MNKILQLAEKAGFSYVDIRDAQYNEVDNPFFNFAKLLIEESTEVMMEKDYHGEWLGEILMHHFDIKNE